MGGDRRRSSVIQIERTDDGVLRLDDAAVRKMSQINSHIVDEFEEAKAAVEKEHQLTIRDAFKLYPKAICFSLIFSTAVIVSQISASFVLLLDKSNLFMYAD
jgi:MFS transporter, SP family, general alpha glucoside:H+ symporter